MKFINRMQFLKHVRDGLKDPLAGLYYLLGGKKKVVELELLRITKEYNAKRIQVKEYYEEIRQEVDFNAHISKVLNKAYYGQFQDREELYVLLRVIKPDVVLETGVAAGLSSAFILKALERNERGVLYSIDLPNYEPEYFRKLGLTPGAILPPGRESGFAVPDSLRKRWVLRIGKSQEVLPSLLEETGRVDIFLHDSEHTYENMTFEYSTVWPYLSEGGLLISHDIGWNSAFDDFADRTGVRQIKPRCLGLGLIVKR